MLASSLRGLQLQGGLAPQSRGLLRILFVWIGEVPAHAGVYVIVGIGTLRERQSLSDSAQSAVDSDPNTIILNAAIRHAQKTPGISISG